MLGGSSGGREIADIHIPYGFPIQWGAVWSYYEFPKHLIVAYRPYSTAPVITVRSLHSSGPKSQLRLLRVGRLRPSRARFASANCTEVQNGADHDMGVSIHGGTPKRRPNNGKSY